MDNELITAVQSELLPREVVVWVGRPNPRVIFHSEDWLAIPFSFLWGGFAIFWLLGATGHLGFPKSSSHFDVLAAIWGTPFVVIGQYLIWGRFVYSYWEKKRIIYAITDRRAIVLKPGLRSRRFTSAFFRDLALIDKSKSLSGTGTISFGGPVTPQWQWGKAHGGRPLTFDDVNEVDSVHRIAMETQERAQPVARGFENSEERRSLGRD